MRWLPWFAAGCAVLGGLQAQETIHVIVGTHERVLLGGDAQRVAVGDEDIAFPELLESREVLVLGKKAGSTTLNAWLETGEVEVYTLRVSRDIALLQGALRDVHPTITAEIAPDRDAVVLRGQVPNADVRADVVAFAKSFLTAGEERVTTRTYTSGVLETETITDPQGLVIDLMTSETPDPRLEGRIAEALRAFAGEDIRVRRVRRAAARNDEEDILVLEGTVQNQVALSRALQLASKMFLGKTTTEEDIEVLADEAGGLVNGNMQQGGQFGGQRGGGGGFGGGGIGGGGVGGGGLGGGLGGIGVGMNNIQRNIGRATVLSVAEGRVLSFLEVVDKPQVRVGVQLYEVDRNALLSFNSEVQLLRSDFPQTALFPALAGTAIQPAPVNPTPVSGTDVQAGLQSLADGLTQQVQIAGSKAALDLLFQVLEARGIAKRLSNPVLTVLSGETAQFQVGGEIPVPQAFTPAIGANVGQGTFNTVAFRNFGVGLSVRPLVGEHDDLTLDLGSLISQPDEVLTTLVRDSTGTAPQTTAFATRSLQTNARLQDGQSLLVGGLVTEATRSDASKVPLLGDIPLLGWLFRSGNDSNDSSELFVVVSPTIVREPIRRARLWAQPDTRTILESCRDAVRRRSDAADDPSAEETEQSTETAEKT